MPIPVILASGSPTRAEMLTNAGVPFDVIRPNLDESMIKESMVAEGHSPRNIADALAEMKALKVSDKVPGSLVIGSDQVLDLEGTIFSKAETKEVAAAQLRSLRNKSHKLISAVVVAEDGKPAWRHVSTVTLLVRDFSDEFLSAYLDRNWPDVAPCVGCYKVEGEGAQLFSRIDGDHFSILGMPLLPLLSYLTTRGTLQP